MFTDLLFHPLDHSSFLMNCVHQLPPRAAQRVTAQARSLAAKVQGLPRSLHRARGLTVGRGMVVACGRSKCRCTREESHSCQLSAEPLTHADGKCVCEVGVALTSIQPVSLARPVGDFLNPLGSQRDLEIRWSKTHHICDTHSACICVTNKVINAFNVARCGECWQPMWRKCTGSVPRCTLSLVLELRK